MQQQIVTIYGRTGCHLCEDVVNLLSPLAKPLNFDIAEIKIDGDEELQALYGELIPVIHINGKYFSHFRVDLEEFKSFLEKHRLHQ